MSQRIQLEILRAEKLAQHNAARTTAEETYRELVAAESALLMFEGHDTLDKLAAKLNENQIRNVVNDLKDRLLKVAGK